MVVRNDPGTLVRILLIPPLLALGLAPCGCGDGAGCGAGSDRGDGAGVGDGAGRGVGSAGGEGRDGEAGLAGAGGVTGGDPLKCGGAQAGRGDREGDDREVRGFARDGEAWFARERERMVEEILESNPDAPITDSRVIAALRSVPRHEFVPEAERRRSYDNTPLPIPESQTISQPYIVALMTQLLGLEGTEKVLEIGTGSGYQAAILGELAGEVYTVEIRPALLAVAKRKLEELKAGGVLHYRKLEAIVGDGSKGYPSGAPYDAIIVTAAPRMIPVDLLNQLRPGGRLVIPLGGDYIQELQLIQKGEDGSYSGETIVPVRFVPLVTGERGRR